MRILLILLCLSGILSASSQTLTLAQAINIALQNNLDIRISRNNLEAAIVNNDISIAGGTPVFEGTSTYNRSLTNLNQALNNGTNTKRSNVNNNNLAFGVQGSFILFNGFRVHAARGRLEALEKQNEQMVNAQIQMVIANVMTRYYDILRQQQYINTISKALGVTLQRKRLIEIKQSVGLANNTDRFQAQIDSTANVQDIRSQQLILDQSKADLLNLLMLRPDSIIQIADTIIVDSTINILTVNERLKLNPDLLSAQQQIRINEMISREIGAQRYPALSVNGGFSFNRSQNGAGFTLSNQSYGPFIGFGVNVPVFNGGLFRRQQKVADIDTRNARYAETKLRNDLKTAVVKSYQAYKNALTQLRTEIINNQTAAALLDLVYKRYELGVGTIIDLRDAEQSFINAGFRMVNASYAAKVAEITLKQLSSNLVP